MSLTRELLANTSTEALTTLAALIDAAIADAADNAYTDADRAADEQDADALAACATADNATPMGHTPSYTLERAVREMMLHEKKTNPDAHDGVRYGAAMAAVRKAAAVVVADDPVPSHDDAVNEYSDACAAVASAIKAYSDGSVRTRIGAEQREVNARVWLARAEANLARREAAAEAADNAFTLDLTAKMEVTLDGIVDEFTITNTSNIEVDTDIEVGDTSVTITVEVDPEDLEDDLTLTDVTGNLTVDNALDALADYLSDLDDRPAALAAIMSILTTRADLDD